jgi:hypothetical protein
VIIKQKRALKGSFLLRYFSISSIELGLGGLGNFFFSDELNPLDNVLISVLFFIEIIASCAGFNHEAGFGSCGDFVGGTTLGGSGCTGFSVCGFNKLLGATS